MRFLIAILAVALLSCSPSTPEPINHQEFYATQDYKSCGKQSKLMWCQIACSEKPSLEWCDK